MEAHSSGFGDSFDEAVEELTTIDLTALVGMLSCSLSYWREEPFIPARGNEALGIGKDNLGPISVCWFECGRLVKLLGLQATGGRSILNDYVIDHHKSISTPSAHATIWAELSLASPMVR
jgi:hypothetical protein